MFLRPLAFFLCSASVFAAPALTYSTYLRDAFKPTAIAADPAGNIYVAGNLTIDDVPSQTTGLVMKLDRQGTDYLYIHYLGGTVRDSISSIAVDSTGNAYVAGFTASPNFPVTTGGDLGTAPASAADPRSFVAKLDPNGNVIYSDLLGASAASQAQAVAVTATGQAIVSGIVQSGNFPTTPGAYTIPSSANHPYLLELNPTGTKLVFSATGIGGSALALDSAGNIYVAGTTNRLDYPTTPGSYQPTFPSFQFCYAPCMSSFQGANQYVSKVDPAGAELIYSTAVSGKEGTTNMGLAVDAAGNAYLTGYAAASYPYTTTPPSIGTFFGVGEIPALPFLTKLDPSGATLLFSVPAGGAGVQVDSTGFVYVAGSVGAAVGSGYSVTAPLPALSAVPTSCVPGLIIQTSAYAAQIDATSGNITGTQFIGGGSLTLVSTALAGGSLWVVGPTQDPNVPYTAGAILPSNLSSTIGAGAYLGAVRFSQPAPASGAPQIACVLDAASFYPAGPVARYQLLSIFGTNLGPGGGVAASDNSTTSLGGISVPFNGVSAPILYASASQLNFAVPLVQFADASSTFQVTSSAGSSQTLNLPLDFASPSLFINATLNQQVGYTSFGNVALALNADGSVNTPDSPARLDSQVSVFLNGVSPDPEITSASPQFAMFGGWSVLGYSQISPFVTKVDVQAPSDLTLGDSFSCPPPSQICTVSFTLYNVYGTPPSASATSAPGESVGGVLFINRGK